MYKYAQINQDNLVIGYLETHVEAVSNDLILTDSLDILGKLWNGTEFETLPDTNVYIKATTDKEIYLLNETITTNLKLVDSNDKLVPLDATYYVPVLRTSDNLQVAFLKLTLVNGQTTNTFSIKAPGIYTVQLDKCHPVPTALMPTNLTFIVEEV